MVLHLRVTRVFWGTSIGAVWWATLINLLLAWPNRDLVQDERVHCQVWVKNVLFLWRPLSQNQACFVHWLSVIRRNCIQLAYPLVVVVQHWPWWVYPAGRSWSLTALWSKIGHRWCNTKLIIIQLRMSLYHVCFFIISLLHLIIIVILIGSHALHLEPLELACFASLFVCPHSVAHMRPIEVRVHVTACLWLDCYI